MDRMTQYAAADMPPLAPLEMRAQTFSKSKDARPLRSTHRLMGVLWRLAAFVPTLALTIVMCLSIKMYLHLGDVAQLEAVMIALVAVTFVWLAFSVNTACLGLIRVAFVRSHIDLETSETPPRNIALLVPVYSEAPWDVFGNASAMLKELTSFPDKDHYTLFILSDTRDPQIADQEERAFAALQAEYLPGASVHYRRRIENTDKKVGNITDWIENWGAAHEAMVVLDADSLMTGAAIRQLSLALAADPDAGLIQSRPTLIGAQTLFGRLQQFSNSVYGGLLAEGLASWAQQEGNFWGHNAIIRTRAFAQSARLPYLRGPRGTKRLILSHDFVEAGMLRRAGWAVKFLPRIDGSYEETPQTLIDYILRDRRWCTGNMQHLRLLPARGFHLMSRFHMLQGALAFLMSPAWLAVVILWSFVGVTTPTPESYFSTVNPLMPTWPKQDSYVAWLYLLFIYGMLLFPKIASAILFVSRAGTRSAYPSKLLFVGSTMLELFFSVLFAPIMMVQHTIASAFALSGRAAVWNPQNRGEAGYSWHAMLRFHWLETCLGIVLLYGIFYAGISVLILPVAISLACAVPLSKLSSMSVANSASRMLRLDTPNTLIEPKIVCSARAERAWLKAVLTETPHAKIIAAE
jgi:membrane glycosyltransferase